jgi:predicted transcriptional regulator
MPHDLPLLAELPPIAQREARRELASALVQLASDLRALNGHLDLASTAILTAVELGHTEGKPVTEAMLARTTGMDRKTVARRLQSLLDDGEVMVVRFQYRHRRHPDVVYVLDPVTANEPKRVRRVREAIKRHAREMAAAIEAMERPQDDNHLAILPANGGVSPMKAVK